MNIAKKISSLVAALLLTATFNSNSMKRQPSDAVPFLPKEMQDTIITTLLNQEISASNLEEMGKAINSLAQANREWNKKINDPDFCLQLIKHLAAKFSCSDEQAAAALQTKAAKERLALQKQVLAYVAPEFNKNNTASTIKSLNMPPKQDIDLSFTYNTNKEPLTILALTIKRHFFMKLREIINYYEAYDLINQINSKGNTLLFICIDEIPRLEDYLSYQLCTMTMQWLLENGADPERANFDGVTPLQLAQEIGKQEIIDMIQDAIAKKHSQ